MDNKEIKGLGPMNVLKAQATAGFDVETGRCYIETESGKVSCNPIMAYSMFTSWLRQNTPCIERPIDIEDCPPILDCPAADAVDAILKEHNVKDKLFNGERFYFEVE